MFIDYINQREAANCFVVRHLTSRSIYLTKFLQLSKLNCIQISYGQKDGNKREYYRIFSLKICHFHIVISFFTMENVYRIKSGDLINIGAKFAEFRDSLCPSSIEKLPETYDDVKNVLGIQSNHEEELLEDSISLNNLAQPDDIPIFDVDLHKLHIKQGQNTVEIPKKAMRLKCVQRRFGDDAVRGGPNSLYKYNRYRYIKHKSDETDEKPDLTPFDDILITVRVYEPFLYKRNEGTKRKPRLSQEFFVLGRQKLTELRDKIYCHCKFGPFTDISNDYNSIINENFDESQANATNQPDPGFFFITDTFYNDYRASHTDYTAEIREWMSRKSDISPVQVKSMDDTTFQGDIPFPELSEFCNHFINHSIFCVIHSDLNVRVGFPQVYRHYVNCEHIISFSDIRLLALDDVLKSSDYPILRCVSSSKMTICSICGMIEATFVVRNSSSHIQDPSFLCRSCFMSFHYVDGKKIGQFQAFRYYGNRPIIN